VRSRTDDAQRDAAGLADLVVTTASESTVEGGRFSEYTCKLGRLRLLLDHLGYDVAALSWRRNFAWLTAGGDNRVVDASDSGFGTILVTGDAVALAAANNEIARLVEEEVGDLGLNVFPYPWHAQLEGQAIATNAGLHGTVVTDQELEPFLAHVRPRLLLAEQRRMRALGRDAAAGFTECFSRIRLGETENVIAARLRLVLAHYSIETPVLLVGADDRISRFRHPIPTCQRLRGSVILVAGASRGGLMVALTRMGVFGGSASQELHDRFEASRRIEQVVQRASRAGATLDAILTNAIQAYGDQGYPDEWKLHHQGGIIAYSGREVIATPGDPTALRAGMAVAWNPSISGAKVEDTLLVGESPEILTRDERWPVDADGAPRLWIDTNHDEGERRRRCG
jgi:Xaa-Pro aminopeptidase